MDIFQGKSTCKIDDNIDNMVNLERKEVMNLRYMETSPYLKHRIWFLSTMENTKCHVCYNCANFKKKPVIKTSQNDNKANAHAIHSNILTFLCIIHNIILSYYSY